MSDSISPRLWIDVSAETIEDSKRRDSSHCMVAQAVRAAFPAAAFVSVDIQTIRFTDRAAGLRYTYLTPRRAQVEIINFDQGVTPEPFRFQLRNAQVTRSGRAASGTDARKLTDSDVKRIREMTEQGATVSEIARAVPCARATVRRARLGRTRLVNPTHGKPGGDGGQQAAVRVGGTPPPVSSRFRRRAFGLRMLDE